MGFEHESDRRCLVEAVVARALRDDMFREEHVEGDRDDPEVAAGLLVVAVELLCHARDEAVTTRIDDAEDSRPLRLGCWRLTELIDDESDGLADNCTGASDLKVHRASLDSDPAAICYRFFIIEYL